MTDDARLIGALDRLLKVVDVLETLKNLTLAEWLVAVTDEGDLPPRQARSKAVGQAGRG